MIPLAVAGLPRVEVAATDPYWSSVSLLLRMEGVNDGTVFTDISPSPKTLLRTGTPVTKTGGVGKFTDSAAYFDGYTDGLYLSSLPFVPTSKFTIEGWVYLKSGNANTLSMFGWHGSTAAGRGGIFIHKASGVLRWEKTSSVYVYSISSTPHDLDAWHHIAFVYDQTDVRIYVDGVLDLVSYGESAGWYGGSYPFTIGGGWSTTYPAFGNYVFGYINEFRVTAGIARYAADFTPPTKQFPNIGPA